MVISYTLIRVQPSADANVYKTVKELLPVKEVITTYGEYDMIVKIDIENLDELDQFIFQRLRAIEGVEATTTLIQANFPKE